MTNNESDTEDVDNIEAATEVEETGAVEEDTDGSAVSNKTPGKPGKQPSKKPGAWRKVVVPALITVLFVASAAVAGWLYFMQFRPDQRLGEDSKNEALNRASEGVVAVLSYAPDTLDADFAKARSYLTGDFLNYYTDYTQRVVTPAAKEKSVKTAAAIIRKGLIEIQPDTAQVLLFLNQSTTSKSMPDGSYSTSAVKVTMERHNGTWLISAFDPV